MIKFCNLFSGSSGNCTFISSESTNILVDAGVSCQRITKALSSIGKTFEEIDGILISHEHIDHTRGLTTICKKYGVNVYATEKTWKAMESLGIGEECKDFFVAEEDFIIGNLRIHPFSIPHDASDPCGFSIYADDKKITIATDIGHMTNTILHQMENSNVLLLESNYDTETLKCSPYPFFLKKRIEGDYGHLSNDMASKAICHLCKNGVSNIILGHLSKENNFPELAYQTVINELSCNNIDCSNFNLSVASRDSVDKVLELK